MPLAVTFLVATLLVATQSPSCNEFSCRTFPRRFSAALDETAGPLTSPLSAPVRSLNRRPQHQTVHYISTGSMQAIGAVSARPAAPAGDHAPARPACARIMRKNERFA